MIPVLEGRYSEKKSQNFIWGFARGFEERRIWEVGV